MHVEIIRIEDPESCSNCEYAKEYIPYYTFPFFNPICEKGHGICNENKCCEDYKYINEVCGHCTYIRKYIKNGKEGVKCVLHKKQVSFNGKSCDDFIKRDGLMEKE